MKLRPVSPLAGAQQESDRSPSFTFRTNIARKPGNLGCLFPIEFSRPKSGLIELTLSDRVGEQFGHVLRMQICQIDNLMPATCA
jgi:hypothetical protein